MPSEILLQALTEPEFRNALAAGLFEMVSNPGALAALVKSNLDAEVSKPSVGSPIRPPPFSEKAGGEPVDLASQLMRLLVSDMKSVVGLGCDDAVVLVDRAGKLHGQNRAAAKMFEDRFLAFDPMERLILSERPLRRFFKAACERFWADWPEELRVLLDNHTLVIMRPAFCGATVVALASISIRRIQIHMDVSLDKLQSVLAVSPKQAQLAQAVMRGLGPVEYAAETGCSVKTARFHLYGLMRKVGCHSQIELGNFLTRTFT